MKKNDTFVKVYRSLLDHEIWLNEPFTKGQAWVDLIAMANWGNTQKIYRGKLQKVERGQIQTSLGYLANRWHWSVGRVRRYFELLNDMGMAHVNGSVNGITITIDNYAFYQDERQARDTSSENVREHLDGILDGTQKKNNKKNNKKERDDGGIVVDANCLNPKGKIVIDSRGCEIFVPDRKEVG